MHILFRFLPNLITLLRLLIVPLFIYNFLEKDYKEAFFLVLFASGSDGIDGYIARRFGLTSKLGAYLDPLADKILVVSAFVLFGLYGMIPLPLLGLTISRDLLLVLGVIILYYMGRDFGIRPTLLSKWNTVLQLILTLWILGTLGFGNPFPVVGSVLVWVVSAMTALSLGDYIRIWALRMRSSS